MSFWAYLWLSMLAISGVAFLGLLLGVGGGAVRELKETLFELRQGSERGSSEETDGEQGISVG